MFWVFVGACLDFLWAQGKTTTEMAIARKLSGEI
jgi:hypothetical protein